MGTANFNFPQFVEYGKGTGFFGTLNKFMRKLDSTLVTMQSGEGNVSPELQNVRVPDNLALVATALPTWSNKSVRNATWSITNTSSQTVTVPAGTVVGTGLDLNPNELYSVAIMNEHLDENTVKVNDTGKSITFTADAEFPVGTTFVLVLEENM